MHLLVIGGRGYIGSFLVEQWLNHSNFSIEVIDQQGQDGVRYQDLSRHFLDKFDSVIWLAGHSSVSQSLADPVGALSNNLVDLYELTLKMKSSQCFVYASSASVYNRQSDSIAIETDDLGLSLNAYDLSKKWFDEISQTIPCSVYGLRFGTVSGPSPKFREDLIVNAMTLSALRNNVVQVRNGGMWRSVLGINDLVSAIGTVLAQKPNAGIYNVASFSATIGDIGKRISEAMGVPLQIEDGEGTYNFRVSTEKLEQVGWRASETLESIIDNITKWVK